LAFVVEEINENPSILPNMTLGFEIHNVAYSESRTLESLSLWLSGQYKMIPNYTCMRDSKSAVVLTGTSDQPLPT
jgi:hypothetical protein